MPTVRENLNRGTVPVLSSPELAQAVNERVANAASIVYQLAIGDTLNRIGEKLAWTWKVAIDNLRSDAVLLTAIFFGIFTGFGMTVAVQCGIVYTIASVAQVAWKDRGLQGEMDVLRHENLISMQRVRNLVIQNEELTLVNNRLLEEKNEAIQERDRVITDREALILARAPLFIEQNRLREENQQLTEQRNDALTRTQQVVIEKAEEANAKKELETQIAALLGELGELRAQVSQVGDYRNLNQNLESFRHLYEKVADHSDREAVTQQALATLIPTYQEHRERLHEALQREIDLLPPDHEARLSLNGILRISKEEMHHVDQISKALHLITELRVSYARACQIAYPFIE